MAIDLEHLRTWIGTCQKREDTASAGAFARLAALLDHEHAIWPEGQMPPLGHWLCFLPCERQSELDSDGHARRGAFLPPVPLPRRMWAGSRVEFRAPIAFDSPITRNSTITDVRHKHGQTGESVFVTIRHEISAGNEPAVIEEQDIVYRNAASASSNMQPAPRDTAAPVPATFSRRLSVDSLQLFRFSALTFNAHRIHYDRDYAREQEGYPGLVVQGPFLAVLLIDHLLRHYGAVRVTRFAFRAAAPLFDAEPFALCLRADTDTENEVHLWTARRDEAPTLTARATIAGRH